MPTTYTHYRFGQDVKNHLPNNILKIINSNIDLYNIGLHGPDILFYYKPFKKNKIRLLGSTIHNQSSNIFFSNALEVIKSCDNLNDKGAALSYILGFICHFTLDCESHKYIDIKISEGNVNHYEIESELDGYLLNKDNLDPNNTILTNHIIYNDFTSNIISLFYKDISPEEINKTLKSMIFYLNHLVAHSKTKRKFIYSLLNLSGNSPLCGLIINYTPNPNCIDSNEILFKIYNQRIDIAVSLINSFINTLNNNTSLDTEFSRNFEC